MTSHCPYSIRLLSGLLAIPLSLSANETTKAGLPQFLDTHCVSCHNLEKTKGDLDLSPVMASPGSTDATTLIMMLDVLNGGDMPPEDEPQPTEAEFAAATMALKNMLQTSAAAPGHGNLVDHKSLFTEPEVRRAATPARLWRLSPHIFMQKANGLARSRFLNTDGGREGGDGLHPAFSYMNPTHSFRDHAETHLFEEATSELLFNVCWQITGLQIGGKGKTSKPRPVVVILGKRPTSELWTDLIQMQFELAVQREASNEELSKLIALGEKTLKETDKVTAIQSVLTAVLLRPDAVYRYEVGQGNSDQHGRVRLAEFELAHALSYALTDNKPDEVMFAAMNSGELSNDAGVRKQVDRLLMGEVSNDRRIRFFQEYFEYPRSVEVFKDKRGPNEVRAEQRIIDADRLVSYILEDDREVLRRLLTEEKVFLVSDGGTANAAFKRIARRLLLPDYGIPSDWDWTGPQPVKPTTGRRSGILTNPVWLLTFSDNEKNQAIQRGHWVYTKLLGGSIPDTPIGVDAVLPEDPHKTLRERMSVTREEYCWRCHSRMDPLGLPFEQFDHFGAWREVENDRPVVTTGEIDIGDPALDGTVKDAFEMMERIAGSERVEQVFTRHVFRYFLGRNETLDDAPTLIDAHRAYREGGGSFRAMVSSLLTSDSFLLRTRGKDDSVASIKIPSQPATGTSPILP